MLVTGGFVSKNKTKKKEFTLMVLVSYCHQISDRNKP